MTSLGVLAAAIAATLAPAGMAEPLLSHRPDPGIDDDDEGLDDDEDEDDDEEPLQVSG